MPKLTKRLLDSLTSEGKAQRRVYDDATPGLGVTVSKTGRKTFFVEYTPPGGGPRRRMLLDDFGALTLKNARDEATKYRRMARRGVDPLEERRREAAAGTFEDWQVEFVRLGEAAGRWAPRSLVEVKRHLRRAVEHFGRRKLAEIDARTVEQFRDRMHEGHGLTEANKSLSTVKACLNEAWRRGLVPANEASKVQRISGELPRTRTLSDREMKELLKAVDRHEDPFFRAAMLWLVLTGARRSEVLRAKWGDLRLDPPDQAEWTIPKAKNKRPSVSHGRGRVGAAWVEPVAGHAALVPRDRPEGRGALAGP